MSTLTLANMFLIIFIIITLISLLVKVLLTSRSIRQVSSFGFFGAVTPGTLPHIVSLFVVPKNVKTSVLYIAGLTIPPRTSRAEVIRLANAFFEDYFATMNTVKKLISVHHTCINRRSILLVSVSKAHFSQIMRLKHICLANTTITIDLPRRPTELKERYSSRLRKRWEIRHRPGPPLSPPPLAHPPPPQTGSPQLLLQLSPPPPPPVPLAGIGAGAGAGVEESQGAPRSTEAGTGVGTRSGTDVGNVLGPGNPIQNARGANPDQPVIVGGPSTNPEYLAEAIEAEKMESGRKYYLVRFVGCRDAEWCPAQGVSKALKTDWWRTHPPSQRTRSSQTCPRNSQ